MLILPAGCVTIVFSFSFLFVQQLHRRVVCRSPRIKINCRSHIAWNLLRHYAATLNGRDVGIFPGFRDVAVHGGWKKDLWPMTWPHFGYDEVFALENSPLLSALRH